MNRILLACLGCLLAAGCSPDKPVNPPKTPTLTTVFEKTENDQSITIGDVESAVSLVAKLSERSTAANISVEEMKTASKAIVMSEVEVKQPFPSEMWVSFDVRSTMAFADAPVAVLGRVIRDEELISSFTTVLGKDARRIDRQTIEGVPQQLFEVNVLEGVTNPSGTLLIQGEIDLILLPNGTDPMSVDFESLENTSDSTGSVLGNLVRITFQEDGPGGP